MHHRTPKSVFFGRKDTVIPVPCQKRPKAPKSNPRAQREQLKEEISKLEHEFLKTRKTRETNEIKYERSHNMQGKTERARMTAYIEGCRMREAVLMDLLGEARNMLVFAEEHDRLQDRGYAKTYLDRMDLWRQAVAKETWRRR
ncbi:hypothetical protein CERZMDRAFT_96716 [Cercospora zeae-maydis SCOH1-5]|uniref:Uncharacterized protein n=1 Tax=Cercospora zeae-maydis SCOH1-5 TaxID=717836 RepID=A0A6A6FI31_9PEZI|nr:hypothetical protein CERZMDRAFT_96716 [Cercospora zeae-maydis SCOH1-5]